MRSPFLYSLLTACCLSAWGQNRPTKIEELLQSPADFDGKRVTFRATYRYGFEWQELYCTQIRSKTRIWLSIPNVLSRRAKQALRRLPKNQGTVNAVFTGTFHGRRSAYGDGGYQYQLDLEAIEQVEVISKSGAIPEALPMGEQKRICRSEIQEKPSAP